MPVHDWKRVGPNVFHDFHLTWIAEIRKRLNQGLLSERFYALIERQPDRSGDEAVNVELGVGEEADTCATLARRISIRQTSGDEIGALIEIVSPGDKSSRASLRSFVDQAVSAIHHGHHLLVADLFPPGTHDPRGIHGAIWRKLGGKPYTAPEVKPLIQVAYVSIPDYMAYVESCGVGDPLAPIPLFLNATEHVLIPLEETYTAAFDAVPRRWRTVLEAEGRGSQGGAK